MIVIATLLVLIAAVLCARLLYSLAIHALPLWCGGTLAWWIFHVQSGLALSALAGIGGAIAALVIVQLLSQSRALPLRIAGIAMLALPAGIAGYFAARGVTAAVIDEGTMVDVLSLASAALLGGTAAMRALALGRSESGKSALASSSV